MSFIGKIRPAYIAVLLALGAVAMLTLGFASGAGSIVYTAGAGEFRFGEFESETNEVVYLPTGGLIYVDGVVDEGEDSLLDIIVEPLEDSSVENFFDDSLTLEDGPVNTGNAYIDEALADYTIQDWVNVRCAENSIGDLYEEACELGKAFPNDAEVLVSMMPGRLYSGSVTVNSQHNNPGRNVGFAIHADGDDLLDGVFDATANNPDWRIHEYGWTQTHTTGACGWVDEHLGEDQITTHVCVSIQGGHSTFWLIAVRSWGLNMTVGTENIGTGSVTLTGSHGFPEVVGGGAIFD